MANQGIKSQPENSVEPRKTPEPGKTKETEKENNNVPALVLRKQLGAAEQDDD